MRAKNIVQWENTDEYTQELGFDSQHGGKSVFLSLFYIHSSSYYMLSIYLFQEIFSDAFSHLGHISVMF